jgi:hypothetical protein
MNDIKFAVMVFSNQNNSVFVFISMPNFVSHIVLVFICFLRIVTRWL